MIQQSIERLMEYNFKTQIYYMSGPGESKGIPPYSLVLHFSRMLKEPIAWYFLKKQNSIIFFLFIF